MKKILMIATGGTIASKPTAAGLAPAASSRELLSYVPEISEICREESMELFRLDSTNIHAAHWIEIARTVEARYAEFDGFVITHGTDTMAYTAAALSYLIRNNRKPVVLTGSQKSVYLRDTDARRNLIDAFSYCADDYASGVHIVFDGNVILGTRAKKTRSRSYNAFSSIDFPDTALIREGKPFYYLEEPMPEGEPVFYRALDDRIFVLKMFPGIRPDIFDYLGDHCDGLIIESFGAGGMPDYDNDEFLARIRAFTAQGKPVVFTTQVEREGSALDKYEVGRKLMACPNILEARSMTLEAACTKLMWILAQTKDEATLSRLFYTPVRNDIF